MRYYALFLALIGTPWGGIHSALGQGTIHFINFGPGFNAPVFMPDCATPAAGEGFFAELYAGRAGSLEPQLGFVGGPTSFFSAGAQGYFNGGVVTIPVVSAGEIATFQVRVYEAAAGSYEAAVADRWLHGKSILFETATGGGVTAVPPLSGLQSFCLVPEPSTVALVFAGALLLAGRRLRRQSGERPR